MVTNSTRYYILYTLTNNNNNNNNYNYKVEDKLINNNSITA